MAVDSKPRLGGWLMVPLAWLIVTLLASTLTMTMYVTALFSHALSDNSPSLPQGLLLQWGASLLTSALVLGYSGWILWIFCKRSQRLPRHYIIWLLLNLVLAIKTFVFSPVSDSLAIRTLLFALLMTSILVPYFKRSQRVKTTFVES
ncbi:DUF2569 domain-containing protein [Erwinia sorbitola]|uniref:DUF2569 family protein n=1 Tax=Erwinia sorbitola TaxID=2681984 RepID=A0A6I6EQR2_9GAMM|nr:DUF2569 domain-containing protein [Erwinia sorbitola]QGU87419.1 DUF2569 family protein [Erwinia sorbitola]